MLPIFAQTASNEAIGSWVSVAAIIVIILAGVFGLAAFFATRREMEAMKAQQSAAEADLKERLSKLEEEITALNAFNEARAKDLHDRVNPVAEGVREIMGRFDAFNIAFTNFTNLIVSMNNRKDKE